MNESAQLVRSNHDLMLQGRVNTKTVNGLFKSFKHELSPEIDSLDCSGVDTCDSSAIGLLLACVRLAHKRDINISIKGLGQQILSLARLYEVETMLQAGTDS
jgi:ABC-type transporter Mla MlaB component